MAALSQNNCEFKYQNKKGGNYLFSIYYETDMKTPLNGTCKRRYNENRIFEKRTFKDGKLMEEILNYESGSSKLKFNPTWNILDSVIATLELFWSNGNRKQTNIYYWDKNKRRCEKYTDFHLNGKNGLQITAKTERKIRKKTFLLGRNNAEANKVVEIVWVAGAAVRRPATASTTGPPTTAKNAV